jgi:hypothetical protein
MTAPEFRSKSIADVHFIKSIFPDSIDCFGVVSVKT